MIERFITEINERVTFNAEVEFIDFFLNFMKKTLKMKCLFLDINRHAFFLSKDENCVTFIKSSVSIEDFKYVIDNDLIEKKIFDDISPQLHFETINKEILKIDSHTMGVLIFERAPHMIEDIEFEKILMLITRELLILKSINTNNEVLNRYQVLTELSDDMIIILENYKVTYANKLTYKKCEVGYSDLINKPMSKFIHPDDMHQIVWLFRNLKTNNEIPKDYFFRILSGEKVIYVKANSKIIKSQNKDAILVYMKDVTEQTTLEKEMAKVSKEKKQMEKISNGLEKFATIGQLSSGIIHEINQPLHSIQTIIDSISYLDKSDKRLSYEEVLGDLAKVSSRVDRISEIINSMRSLMNVNDSVKVSKINVNMEIRKIVHLKNLASKKSNITIDTKFYTKDLELNFSVIQFQQVIINLIDNALSSLKKVKNKNIDKKIVISTSKIDNRVVIEVKDNGIGIDMEDVEEIFSPFFSTNSSKTNSGLGLFIIKQILTCYNGSIHCKNNDSGGARFIIEVIE